MDKGFVFTIDAILGLIILIGLFSVVIFEEPLTFDDVLLKQEKIDLEYVCFLVNDCQVELEKFSIEINDEFEIVR
jgi:hypothetical protein